MNWEAIGAIGELAAALVVVLSLFYLAAQIRNNTKQSRLNSIQAVNASNDSAFNPIYIPENTHIWTKGHADPDALDDRESQVFGMLMTRLIACFDTTTYQMQQGSYDAELYEGTAWFYSTFIATPGGSKWYAENRKIFSEAAQASLARTGDGQQRLEPEPPAPLAT